MLNDPDYRFAYRLGALGTDYRRLFATRACSGGRANNRSCLPCPAGTRGDGQGALACVACAPGTAAPFALEGSLACVACAAGFAAARANAAACDACVPGRYAVAAATKRDLAEVRKVYATDLAVLEQLATLPLPPKLHKKLEPLQTAVRKLETILYELSLSAASATAPKRPLSTADDDSAETKKARNDDGDDDG